jgi:hypothetical protein
MTPYEHRELIKSRITSCYDNDLIKAEGSRGGKVIGHTKSGKPVYENHDPENYKDFNHNDHFEAKAFHNNHARSLTRPLKGTASKQAENKANKSLEAAKWHDEQESKILLGR